MTPAKPTTCAIYARVSTTDQKCQLQLTELREYAARCGWSIIEYVDQGVSGSKRSRPALDKLLADARLRKFAIVAVWKLDRFGRSLINLIDLLRDLDEMKIRFVAPTQGIDTDHRSPAGRFMVHILAALAEFERELIRERTLAGVAEAKRRGKKCGRPMRVFRRDLAIEMHRSGMGYRAIAAKLGVSFMTVKRAVTKVPK